MKKRMIILIVLVGIMGFIYYMSDQPVIESGEMSFVIDRWICRHFVDGYNLLPLQDQEAMVYKLDFWVRKSAHFAEYMLLGAALMAAVQLISKRNRLKSGIIVAVTVGSLYAVLDEIHQHFVPGRACQLRDVIIDICGVTAGALMVFCVIWVRKKHIDRKQQNAPSQVITP
ncbi:MAG: VanZ family protein [Lentihominibacter sp.]